MSQLRVNRRFIRFPGDGGGPLALSCTNNPNNCCDTPADQSETLMSPIQMQRYLYRLPRRGAVAGTRCVNNPTSCVGGSGPVPPVTYPAINVESRGMRIPGGAVGTFVTADDPSNCNCPCPGDGRCATGSPYLINFTPNAAAPFVSTSATDPNVLWECFNVTNAYLCASFYYVPNLDNVGGYFPWILGSVFQDVLAGPDYFVTGFQIINSHSHAGYNTGYAYFVRKGAAVSNAPLLEPGGIELPNVGGFASNCYLILGFGGPNTETQGEIVYSNPNDFCNGNLLVTYNPTLSTNPHNLASYPSSILLSTVATACPPLKPSGWPCPARNIFLAPFPNWLVEGIINDFQCPSSFDPFGNRCIFYCDPVLYSVGYNAFSGYAAWEGYWYNVAQTPFIVADAYAMASLTFRLEDMGSGNWRMKLMSGINTLGTDAHLFATYQGSVANGCAPPSVAKSIPFLSSVPGVIPCTTATPHLPANFYWY